KYHLAPMSDPYFALPLYSAQPTNDPENKERDKKLKTNAAIAAAGVVAAIGLPEGHAAAVAGWQAEAVVRRGLLKEPAKLKPILQAERTKRIPVGLWLLGTAAADSPLAMLAPTAYAARPQYLPLMGPVKDEMKKMVETNRAQKWVIETMVAVRDELEKNKGNKFLLWDARSKLRTKYRSGQNNGLTLGSTTGETGWRNRYDIDKDPGMEPLYKAYERWYDEINQVEGLGGTASMFRADTFYRL